MTVLHTRDRVRANSDGFVEPLRNATGVWIDGGRQWRLTDAYPGTAVEREIKAVLARGGVVGGGSAGATIQGSYLVRGSPDGNDVMIALGYETGFGLLSNSAIDQLVNTRGREKDLDAVVAAHPGLLGIGIDESGAILVHGNSFKVVDGQVAIHDGQDHNGALYYFLSPGQKFNLHTRTPSASGEISNTEERTLVQVETGNELDKYPFVLTVISAIRRTGVMSMTTTGVGLLSSDSRGDHQRISFECDTGVFNHEKPAFYAYLTPFVTEFLCT